tara:strand:+ start:1163 stop:1360 length:198 start_codon:yes stop_codon:yes gene_type:complete
MILLNYTLNKTMPFILTAFLLFYKLGFHSIEAYAILALSFYICHFNYKVGYAVGLCEAKGIKIEN